MRVNSRGHGEAQLPRADDIVRRGLAVGVAESSQALAQSRCSMAGSQVSARRSSRSCASSGAAAARVWPMMGAGALVAERLFVQALIRSAHGRSAAGLACPCRRE